MSNIRNLLEKMDQFAGQAVGQKPGDQVRGTERATRKKSGEHPFKGRLVGGCEESAGSLLKELQQELNRPAATARRDLFREFAEFKQDVTEGLDQARVSPETLRVVQQLRKQMSAHTTLQAKKTMLVIKSDQLGPQDQKLVQDTLTQAGIPFKIKDNRVEAVRGCYTNTLIGIPYDQQGVTEEDAWHSSEDAPQDAWHSSQDAPQDAWHSETSESQDNPVDAVTMDIPLLIRIMEYAREDAKTDQDLHRVAERLTAMSADGNTLDMDQYDAIVGQPELDEEIAAPITPGVAPAAPAANTAANPAAMAQMKAQQLKTLAAQKKSTQDQIKQTQEQLDALRKQLASLSNPANVAMPGVTGTAE